MARTRGAEARAYRGDGELLGKGGVPISTNPNTPLAYDVNERVPLDRQGNFVSPAASALVQQRNISGGTVLRGPGAEPVKPLGAVVGYRSDAKSWARDMDAWELARLLDLAFRNPGELGDGLAIDLTVDEFGALDGNLRRHFLAVRG